MNERSWKAAEALIPPTYVKQGKENISAGDTKISVLLEQRKWPDEGLTEANILSFLHSLSSMDSNNFVGNAGVGEREARLYSNLVSKRHYGMGHGIGRSGDLAVPQPKAAGSSIINLLTNALALDVIRALGLKECEGALVVPMATGMCLSLCLLSLRETRPNAKYVVWPRIDQKTCFKCIFTSGFQPIIIENTLVGDELRTDLGRLEQELSSKKDEILCVLTVNSCFAPRVPDDLCEVGKLCKIYNIPHVVNNAYGLQSFKAVTSLRDAYKKGRVDLFVQSTDKNFMVPVGGAIVASFDVNILNQVSKSYPGRASGSPSVDLLITLLEMGKKRYLEMLRERKAMYGYLRNSLKEFAESQGERLLETKSNDISMAMTLSTIPKDFQTEFGSMLFLRHVSGTRVVSGRDVKTIGSHSFTGWGAHCNAYSVPYITAAAAIGMRKEDVDLFIVRLGKCFKDVASRSEKKHANS